MSDDDVEISEEELAVDELRAQGADLSERRRVDHYLYFPTRIHADAAAEEARRLGLELTPTVELDEESGDWLVLATHEIVVDVPELARLRARFEAFASAHGGEYDGWNIAVDTRGSERKDDDDWSFDPDAEPEE